ncbi:hypothetical protein BaRGS_00007551 [Batillaria attramentaria]|uniref:Uncharacterized protein n=1 Tax=Batillaria attramentaria TaxID=370345 RepID=A0ABD0LP89_9CAEN
MTHCRDVAVSTKLCVVSSEGVFLLVTPFPRQSCVVIASKRVQWRAILHQTVTVPPSFTHAYQVIEEQTCRSAEKFLQ